MPPTSAAGPFEPESPWPLPDRSACAFYHSMDLPDGESVSGIFDLRGRFDDYIGRYPLGGKTVLDVGTASGFLAFSAEACGARVTALEIDHARGYDRLPFKDSLHYRDRHAWAADAEQRKLGPRKRGFWYAWHRLKSRVEVVYASLDALPLWERKFDVVIAGAIIEHVADPVSTIGALARLANEAVIIAFTDVFDSDELTMRAMNDWSNPIYDYTWWMLSRGLYRRVFENVGFTIKLARASAVMNPFEGNPYPRRELLRPTIIARRR